MNLIRQGENQLLDSNSLNGGQLRIGASDTICRYYLVPFLSEFHKRYPNIHIKVTNRTSIECARLLDNGQVDFILTNYPNSGLGGTQNIHVLREFNDIFVANETYFSDERPPGYTARSCRRFQSSCWIARVPPANFCTTCSRSTSSTSYRRLN